MRALRAPRRGLPSYDAKEKQDWRGWQWNRIVERLAVPLGKATVLYLCGPNDADRDKALARGFRNENLIAVDRCEESIRAVRCAGGFGIAHDLAEVLLAWPREWPVNVVVADFCAGLDASAAALLGALVSSRAVGCAVVSVNLQRGRDAASNLNRRWMSEAGYPEDHLLHRGKQFEEMTFAVVHGCVKRAGYGHEAAAIIADRLLDGAAHGSYRASRVVMDSVVLRWPAIIDSLPLQMDDGLLPARRKISALRAMRTSRLQRRRLP